MKIGFKVRIYPNKEQEEKLFYFCKCSHEMWNYVVAKYKNSGEKMIFLVLNFSLKALV